MYILFIYIVLFQQLFTVDTIVKQLKLLTYIYSKYFLLATVRSMVTTTLLSMLILVICFLSFLLDLCSQGFINFVELIKETTFGFLNFLSCQFSDFLISALISFLLFTLGLLFFFQFLQVQVYNIGFKLSYFPI